MIDPNVAQAQTCIGMRESPVSLSGRRSFPGAQYSVRVGGMTHRLFGGVTASLIDPDAQGLRYAGTGVDAGMSIAPKRGSSSARVCPFLSGFEQRDHYLALDGTSQTSELRVLTAGLSIGKGAPMGHSVDGIPMAGFVVMQQHRTNAPDITCGLGTSCHNRFDTYTETGGVLTLGVTFLFGKRLSFQPAMQLPFGVHDISSLMLTGAFAFGGR